MATKTFFFKKEEFKQNKKEKKKHGLFCKTELPKCFVV